MMFEARPDLFSGGHQHHDAGHFYLSAHGVDWGVEGNNGLRSSLYHSVVMIDAKGQGAAQHFSPMRVKSFTAATTEDAEQRNQFTAPKKDAPCLAVLVLHKTPEPRQGEYDYTCAPAEIRRQSVTGTERLVIATRAVDPKFRIALVPFRWGEPMPQVVVGDEARTCTLRWTEDGKDESRIAQQDVLTFTLGEDGRTRLAVSRDNRVVGAVE
jgi:hypothetical protein